MKGLYCAQVFCILAALLIVAKGEEKNITITACGTNPEATVNYISVDPCEDDNCTITTNKNYTLGYSVTNGDKAVKLSKYKIKIKLLESFQSLGSGDVCKILPSEYENCTVPAGATVKVDIPIDLTTTLGLKSAAMQLIITDDNDKTFSCVQATLYAKSG